MSNSTNNDVNGGSISEAEAQLISIPTPDPIAAQNERDRFHQFVISNVARHRLLYSRQLGVMAITDLDLVLQALVPLATDSDHQVRVTACTDLADIYRAGILQNLHDVVLDVLVHVVQIALLDESGDLRSTVMDAVLAMAPMMSRSKITNIIMPITDQMWNQTSNDEIRASSVVLQYRLIDWLTSDQRYRIRQQTASWSKDPSFRVRKAVARYMFEVGEEYLPVAESLSRDPIWSVRQAIVQGLIQSLQRIESHALRQEFLIPQMKRACADISRWVRKDSYEILGAFLFHLDPDQIDDELLSLFTSLASLSQDAADSDAHFACAYHYPAVIARLGRRRWSEISTSYLLLCRNPTFKVRRTLAYSLCEVGRILGPEITDSDLLPVFEIFFKDLDEVRQGIVDNLTSILSCMTMKSRLTYTDLLWDIQREASRQWRYKASLASQLVQLSELFPIDVICTRLLPLALTLMHDRVAFVRQVAVQSIGGLLQLVQSSAPGAFDELMTECLNLSTAESCHDRQLFLYLCQSLLYTIRVPLFRQYFLNPFVALAHDRVINVRRLLARIVFELPFEHKIRSDPDVILAMRYLHSAEQAHPVACPLSPSIQLPLAIAGLEPMKSATKEVDVDIRSDDIKGSGEFVQDSGPFVVSV